MLSGQFKASSDAPYSAVTVPDSASAPSAPSTVANSPKKGGSMAEFYQLCRELFTTSLVLMAIAFGAVWLIYGLNTALNYLLGASASLIYLRLLARSVERLGNDQKKLGKTQLLVVVVVIILAARWQELHIIPVFLGFLTYKAAILVYMFRTVLPSP
ncbi:ATP synthase subunit I [Thermosynechococcus sichuanensis E542]|uniref:ATP synthase subunit I n=1 Tax=Thermosynechococcus sichuanensis E542 TaxID=2016101 RepID=A0A3B7MBD1_9CYAN|nr:ATP synthase subunit I [Thermosynechococcus vestitus]AXY67927.1 ATP synthase subunit I [Thermosynechococcus vestitus E542]